MTAVEDVMVKISVKSGTLASVGLFVGVGMLSAFFLGMWRARLGRFLKLKMTFCMRCKRQRRQPPEQNGFSQSSDIIPRAGISQSSGITPSSGTGQPAEPEA